MALPSSGQISLSDIYAEINGSHSTQQCSLRSLSSSASKTTPDAISEFHGYSSASLSVSPSLISFNYNGLLCSYSSTSYVTVTASSGNSWTATRSATWIFISSSSGTGNGGFGVSVSSNGGTLSRFGSVTVSSDAPDKTVSIDQTGQGDDCTGGGGGLQ